MERSEPTSIRVLELALRTQSWFGANSAFCETTGQLGRFGDIAKGSIDGGGGERTNVGKFCSEYLEEFNVVFT